MRHWRYVQQQRKLISKAQKAGCVDRLPEVFRLVWGMNARRRVIAKLRFNHNAIIKQERK